MNQPKQNTPLEIAATSILAVANLFAGYDDRFP